MFVILSAMGRKAGVTAEETRQELLDATMRVLLRNGVTGTRVSEVAQEAGIKAGSIYNHFASKTDLIMAAITAHAPHVIGDLLAGTGDQSVIEAFRQIGTELADPSQRTVGPVMLELIANAGRDSGVAEIVRDSFVSRGTEIVDVVRLAQDSGEIDPALDAEALSRFVNMVALGSLAVATLDLKPVDREAWTVVLDRMLDAARPRKEGK
jgi:AcrR family transcriptional regulator